MRLHSDFAALAVDFHHRHSPKQATRQAFSVLLYRWEAMPGQPAVERCPLRSQFESIGQPGLAMERETTPSALLFADLGTLIAAHCAPPFGLGSYAF